MHRLIWLGARLLGYPGRAPRRCDAEDGALLSRRRSRFSEHPELGQLVTFERFRYASEGLEVAAWAARPHGHAGDLPLLVYSRGGLGPHGVICEEDLRLLAHLAEAGPYLCVATEYRGNAGGHGEDRAGADSVADLVNVRLAAAALGGVDVEDWVLAGFSRGASNCLMAVRAGARPKAVGVIGVVADSAQAFREGSTLLRGAFRVSCGGAPGPRTAAEYSARSPLEWADQVPVPVLMLHAADDDVIRPSQSRALAARFEELGVPHELVLVPSAVHKLLDQEALRNRHLLDWFRRWRLGYDAARPGS